jgi:hypothetical protein
MRGCVFSPRIIHTGFVTLSGTSSGILFEHFHFPSQFSVHHCSWCISHHLLVQQIHVRLLLSLTTLHALPKCIAVHCPVNPVCICLLPCVSQGPPNQLPVSLLLTLKCLQNLVLEHLYFIYCDNINWISLHNSRQNFGFTSCQVYAFR